MIKTLCILGTRPEAIKMYPVIRELSTRTHFSNKVCVTGQHAQMIDPLLDLFNIKPNFNLKVMTDNQDLSSLFSNIISGLKKVYEAYKPDLIIVHGDTTSALAASLSAYYHHIPVAHVEAGLRTKNIYSPWPEEINRKLIASIADIHFAPTDLARQNLICEGVSEDRIYVTGNTVIDALHATSALIETNLEFKRAFDQQLKFLNSDRRFILITAHRRENFGIGLKNICHAIALLANKHPDIDFIYPVHLNPSVQVAVKNMLHNHENVFLVDPLDYLTFTCLMKKAFLVLTDSGGVQEEAPALGVPVLVMREHTERLEGILAGAIKLVGTSTNQIVSEVEDLLSNNASYIKMKNAVNPFGDGNAAKYILMVLQRHFTNQKITIEEPI